MGILKTVGIIAVVFVCFLLLLGAIGLLISPEAPTKAPTSIGVNESQQPEKTSSEELSLKVGETAKTSKIEVTLLSAQKTKSYTYYVNEMEFSHEARPGNIFVLAEFEIKNIGSEREYVGFSQISLIDSEGIRYDPGIYLGQDALPALKELYKNEKTKGIVLFEIPENASGLKVRYDFGNLLVGVKLATWTIE